MVATDKLSSQDQIAAPAAIAGPSDATLKAVAAVINDHRIHYGARLVKMVDGIETYTARVEGHEPKDFEGLDEALEWARGVADADRAKLVVAALTGQQVGAKPAGDGAEAARIAIRISPPRSWACWPALGSMTRTKGPGPASPGYPSRPGRRRSHERY